MCFLLFLLFVHCRKIHSESAKTWLDILHNESVPYLVCLSHADKLYANHMMSKVTDCTKSEAHRRINMELQVLNRVNILCYCKLHFIKMNVQWLDEVLLCKMQWLYSVYLLIGWAYTHA